MVTEVSSVAVCTLPGPPLAKNKNGPRVPVYPGRLQDGEFECGNIKEAHFHHYIEGKIIGHFKVGSTFFKIPDRLKVDNDAMKLACCNARAAIASNINSRFPDCFRCMGQLWKQTICRGFISACPVNLPGNLTPRPGRG